MIYNIGLPLLSFHMYFLYSLGSSLTINSAIVLLTACECPYPCQLAGRLQICQLPLHIAPPWHQLCMLSSWLPLTQWVSWYMPWSCIAPPLVHPHAFMISFIFSFKNIKYLSHFFSCHMTCLVGCHSCVGNSSVKILHVHFSTINLLGYC